MAFPLKTKHPSRPPPQKEYEFCMRRYITCREIFNVTVSIP